MATAQGSVSSTGTVVANVSITYTFNTSIPVGTLLILFASNRWTSTFSNPPTGVDSRGNVWAGNAGSRATTAAIYFMFTIVTVPLQVGDTMTMTRAGTGSFSTGQSPSYPGIRAFTPGSHRYFSFVSQISYLAAELSSGTSRTLDVAAQSANYMGRSSLDFVIGGWATEGNAATITSTPQTTDAWTPDLITTAGSTARFLRSYWKQNADPTDNTSILTSTAYVGLQRGAAFDEKLMSTSFSVWDGTAEAPVFLDGIWNGSTIISVTAEVIP